MSRFHRALVMSFFAYIAVMAALATALHFLHRPEPDLTLCPFCHQ